LTDLGFPTTDASLGHSDTSPDSLEDHTSQKHGCSLRTITAVGKDAGSKRFLASFIPINCPVSDVMEDYAKKQFFFASSLPAPA